MHHLRVLLAITPIEEVQHILLEFLAVLLDHFSCLIRKKYS